jgi:hypothetical protein
VPVDGGRTDEENVMRHLLSIVISLVSAPIIYLATGYGLVKWQETGLRRGEVEPLLLAMAGFIIAGGLLGVLLLTRLSPLGPALVGALFMGLSMWAVYDPSSLGDILDFELFGEDNIAAAPIGLLPLLAIPLLGTLFAFNRWRAKAPAGALAGPADGGYGDGGYQQPSYQYPPTPQPSTPSAYAQQYGTYGSSYGSQYGVTTPDPVS